MNARLQALIKTVLGLAEMFAWFPPLLARLTTGLIFANSGWGKLHNLSNVTSFFDGLGIPLPGFNAVFVSTIELVCGGLLLIGLLTRLAAAPLIATMIVAIITAKRDELDGLIALFGFSEWGYIVLLAYLVFYGSGALSIDHVLEKRLVRPNT